MPELKYRKVPREENVEVKRKSRSQSNVIIKHSNLRNYFLTILGFTTCMLGFYLIFFQWNNSFSHNAGILDNLSLSLGLKNYVYAIVIDAGSTGSRITLYGFISSPSEKSLKLHQEFFKELKPGISYFAHNPKESVKNLEKLINEAKVRIPKDKWAKTSVVFRATAGLRLLPGHKADGLLKEAKLFLKSSGFLVDEDSVQIMDGSDEGLLSWFTVNFLSDRLGGEGSNTVVALDLGGGSTQVSFVPTKNDTLTHLDNQYLNKIAVFHRDLEVYSRSYLGLGLNEGRKRILQFKSNHSTILRSECINPLINTKWAYGGVEYTIQGSEKAHYLHSEEKGEIFTTPIVDFNECEEIVKAVVSKFGKTPSLVGKQIYAFSYYFDRAADCGLIDFKMGGMVTLHDYISSAKAKCREANTDQPFMCLDLVFISVLLRDIYGISDFTKIHLVKKIDEHEVSWALGAAFLNLQNQM